MAGLGTLLVLIIACLGAGALGHARGRQAERLRLFRKYGVTSAAELRGASEIEANLRRSVGVRRIHPDPDSASRQHKARIIR